MLKQCNSTLENETSRSLLGCVETPADSVGTVSETAIWNGHTVHEIGKWIGAVFALVAVALSFLLIFLHATHYLKPNEQKQ